MSSRSNVQCTEVGGCNRQKLPFSPVNLPEDSNVGPEEDEDEDIDFNPFLKETSSPEASSNLSTENEGLGADLVDNVGSSSVCKETNFSSKLTDEVQECTSKDSEDDAEEVVMQCQVSVEGACGKDSEDVVMEKPKKRKLTLAPRPETGSIYPEGGGASKETAPIKVNTSSSGTDAVEDVNKGELTDSRNYSKVIMDLDDEDAICRRTRARYSLANFTLDELETFLQETDDDDDLQNVDDEQEYRRFLASVLQDADNEGQMIQENENVDDEDEENDADFEIEIEEALDSDLDEITRGVERKEKYPGAGRRPETRQNRQQKASVQSKKKLLGQANRPLRPLLPIAPNAQMASFPTLNWQKLMPEGSLHCPSPTTQDGLVNGFTPHQIGQLHCLIHEHVQLLVQVFSLCVLDPPRQHVAVEAQRMISEVVDRRDEVLSWRKVAYPDFCFRPPYIHPSVFDGLPKFHGMQIDSSFASTPQKGGLATNDMIRFSYETSPSEGRNNVFVHGGHLDPLQTSKDSLWMPLISGPVLSILDTAPLSLVGRYMTDVATAVQEYQKRHVDSMFDSHFEREPLFPLSSFPSPAEANSEVLRGSTSQAPSTVPSSSPGCQPPKKTLAAALVESTKKQSVALAPKKIVKLAQRFYPLFNSALFPHKPPPAAVANRVLFTDAEDELLAMGLMEYNTDWKAIQQRFLPCKSKHQIFVRQKNRCSSKAPENPIKAVRRMKTSPLTAEEKARIHEGLRVLKLDWISVWKFIVPYRDPSLLPRQWRIALGTQKSYKSDAAKREKRRLYESQRRKSKAAALASWQTAPEKEISEDYLVDNAGEGNKSGDDNMDDEDEAYVHEAFLGDWGPGNSRFTSSELLPISSLSRRDLQSGSVLAKEGFCVGGIPYGDEYAESHPENSYMHEFLSASEQSQCLQNQPHFTHVRYSASYTVASNHFDPDCISKSSKGQISLRPYRIRRRNDARLVRLAPDLPPVNLPPSVRVISQSAFKSYHCGSFHSTKISCGGAETKELVPIPAQIAKSGTTMSVYSENRNTPSYHSTANFHPQDLRLHIDQLVTEDKGAESDLQMHPLLFQMPEDGRLAYCPVNCSTSASSTFNFLPGNQLQADFHQFGKPQHEVSTVDHFYTSLRSKENPLSSCTIDFHPLLQRTDDLNNDSVIVSSTGHMSVDLESFRGNSAKHKNPDDSVMNEAQVNSGSPASVPDPDSPSEKANELDLEIHLSSTSKEKIIGSGNVTQHNSNGCRMGLLDGSTIKESQNINTPSRENSSCPIASVAASASDQGILGDHAMVLASSNRSRFTECNMSNQHVPEIVMEQEELSDSEEDIGEHVEFECEEMADSEGEESNCEQLINIQNKESTTVMVEKQVVTNGNYNYQRCGPRITRGPKANVCATSKGNSRSRKSGVMSRSKHSTGSTLQLSLQSSAKGSSTHSKPRQVERSNEDDRAGKILLSRPNRSCKRMRPNAKGGTMLVHPLDMLQRFHPGNAEGTTIFTPIRKPRKRVYRNDSRSKSGCISNTNLVDRQPNDTCLRIDVRTKEDGQGTTGVQSPKGG